MNDHTNMPFSALNWNNISTRKLIWITVIFIALMVCGTIYWRQISKQHEYNDASLQIIHSFKHNEGNVQRQGSIHATPTLESTWLHMNSSRDIVFKYESSYNEIKSYMNEHGGAFPFKLVNKKSLYNYISGISIAFQASKRGVGHNSADLYWFVVQIITLFCYKYWNWRI